MTRYTTQQTAMEPSATTGFHWVKARAARLALAVMALLALGALSACGGSGGFSAAEEGPGGNVALTGQFLDAPVEGLGYSTPTQSGVTDAAGRFQYLDGETVSFTLYGTPLSSSIGFSTLSRPE